MHLVDNYFTFSSSSSLPSGIPPPLPSCLRLARKERFVATGTPDCLNELFPYVDPFANAYIPSPSQFVADGVFYSELNEFLARELAEEGYSGVEVRVTPTRTEVIIRATRTKEVLGEKGRRIRELTSVVQKRFNFPEGQVELYAERVTNRALCAVAQAESLKSKLLQGLPVRRYLFSHDSSSFYPCSLLPISQ